MNRNYTKTLFAAFMLLSFLGVTLCSMVYMAKDNNYDNTIFQYFNLSKEFYNSLIYLKISKDALINGMNLCSLLFIISNFFLAMASSHKPGIPARSGIQKPFVRSGQFLFLLLLLFWAAQIIIYNTVFYRFVYCGGLGFLPSPAAFRSFYDMFHRLTVAGNFLTLMSAFCYLVSSALKKEPMKELRYIKWSFTVIDLLICALYFYMYYSLPGSFLWVSRSVGYTSYRTLEMNSYIGFMQIIPYLVVAFILILWINLYRYDKALRRMRDEEYVFSNIVASSEISTRVFSHYVKNELLGILSETERMMQYPEKGMGGLENIKSSCMEVYERLDSLQKNANRIVLNQSRNNLHELLAQSLSDYRDTFSSHGITASYHPECSRVIVFCDPAYMHEVLHNIYNNAIDAMTSVPDGKKEFTITTVRYETQVRIALTDTGPGIQPSVAGRLFEPFVSTKSTRYNWGIGLSFVKRIINSHSGKIEAHSLPGGGTAFYIYLPLIHEF